MPYDENGQPQNADDDLFVKIAELEACWWTKPWRSGEKVWKHAMPVQGEPGPVDDMPARFVAPPSSPCSGGGPPWKPREEKEFQTELTVEWPMARNLTLSDGSTPKSSISLMMSDEATSAASTTIVREMNIITMAEALQHEAECIEAMLEELRRWATLGAFKRFPRAQSHNVLDARWVLKWKRIGKERKVRARMTVRGYKDAQASMLNTFAATASRWGQRLTCSVAVQLGWKLFSMDISQAFLRGLPFTQLAAECGEVLREVCFEVPLGAKSCYDR